MSLVSKTAEAFAIYADDFLHFQGMGGNVSMKNDQFVAIKKSGVALSPSEPEKYLAVSLGQNTQIHGVGRPSMELGMHLAFGQKLVFHSHWLPVFFGFMPSADDMGIEDPSVEIKVLDFRIPGEELRERIAINVIREKTQVFYLKNHGLVIATDSEFELGKIITSLDRAWLAELRRSNAPQWAFSRERLDLSQRFEVRCKALQDCESLESQRVTLLGPDFFLFLRELDRDKNFSPEVKDLLLAAAWLLELESAVPHLSLDPLDISILEPLLKLDSEKYRIGMSRPSNSY